MSPSNKYKLNVLSIGVKLVLIATVTAFIIVYAVELLYKSTVNVAELLASTLDTIIQFILYH